MEELLKFALQMQEGVQGLTKCLEKNIEEMKSKMTKEDAEEFNRMLKDSDVNKMVKEQTDKILEINNLKNKNGAD